MFKILEKIIKWPVEEIGKNSVSPSMMPKIIACKNDINL
jgi:hypothetical protein